MVLAVVKVAAEPVVFWLPAAFTPGKFMSAKPLKSTPPIFLAVVKVAAEPVVFWLPVAFTPGKVMFAAPLKETPPMSLAFVKVAAEVAVPFKAPIKVAAVTVSPTCNFFAIPTPPVTISAPIVEAVLSVSDHNLTLPVVRLIVNVLLPDTL